MMISFPENLINLTHGIDFLFFVFIHMESSYIYPVLTEGLICIEIKNSLP